MNEKKNERTDTKGRDGSVVNRWVHHELVVVLEVDDQILGFEPVGLVVELEAIKGLAAEGRISTGFLHLCREKQMLETCF